MNYKNLILKNVLSWSFGVLVFIIGVLNLYLIHPVPGIVYLLLSAVFFPPVNKFLSNRAGFTIPVIAKIILGIVIVWFTVGISDLAEMYGL